MTNLLAADLLRGRYWEGLTQEQMIEAARPKQQSLRNFSHQQEKAIDDFVQLLIEREETCRQHVKDLSTSIQPPRPNLFSDKRDESVSAANQNGEVPSPPDSTTDTQVTAEKVDRPTTPLPGKTSLFARAPKGKAGCVVIGPLLAILAILSLYLWLRNTSSANPEITRTLEADLSSTPPTATSVPKIAAICGETQQISSPGAGQFLRSQGVTAFKVNPEGGIVNNSARSLAIDDRGLWIGYFTTTQISTAGVGYFNKLVLGLYVICPTISQTRK